MSRKIDLFIADPAGNTTAMVLTPTPRSEYRETASKLLDMDFGDHCGWADSVMAEQVAFILPEDRIYKGRSYPSMEMCGLEFCGNASRSFAYYRTALCGDDADLSILVSGCDHPLEVEVDTEAGDAGIYMPLPLSMKMFSAPGLLPEDVPDEALTGASGPMLVDMGGITHLILPGADASPDLFNELKDFVYDKLSPDMEAFGVMFIDPVSDRMTPVVYVRDVDTTYFEGSCASGAAAASCALSSSASDGTYRYTFRQPAGTLFTSVIKRNGTISDVRLNGHIEISDVISIEI